MERNIFVLGIDDFNLAQLRSVRNVHNYRFHPLLTYDEVKAHGTYPFRSILEHAREKLEAFDGRIDAIVGYWDFPVTSIVPVLCRDLGLPGPSVESVARCEHKYWSRVEQRKVAPEMVPGFAAVDPFDDNAAARIQLDYPFWLKPVKGTDSLLGFKIHDRRELEEALAQIRAGIGHIAEAFDDFLSHVDMPKAVAARTGRYCIAEELIHGRQCTVSGYVFRGRARTYGVIDSINYPNGISFFRYQYPSRLPAAVQERLTAASCRIMERIGYDQAAFNIEYFYDAARDRIALLEINPRISQSHGHIYEQVDGQPNHQVMVELALGDEPCFPHREGPFGCAAEFHLREFEDGVVKKVPSSKALRAIERDHPGTFIHVAVEKGTRLSEMIEQDSYSYDVAHVFTAARDQRELLKKYDHIVAALPLEIER